MAADEQHVGEIAEHEAETSLKDDVIQSLQLGIPPISPPQQERKQTGTIHRLPSSRRPGAIWALIGPYAYRWWTDLQDESKKRCLADLINRSPENNTIERYVEIGLKNEQEARKQYSGDIFSDVSRDFVEMLVLDGCFVIEFMIKRCIIHFGQNPHLIDPLSTSSQREDLSNELHHCYLDKPLKDAMSSVMTDLLVPENQLPLFVLDELFQVSNIPILSIFQYDLTFLQFALIYFTGDATAWKLSDNELLSRSHHLLHLYYLFQDPLIRKIINSVKIAIPCIPSVPAYRSGLPTASNFPSAKYLKERDFIFKKLDTPYLFDISCHGRTINIPALFLNGDLMRQLLLLLAFETSSPVDDKKCKNYIAAYITFMGCLIHSEDDAAILRDCGIIDSRSNSNSNIAVFFNDIAKDAYTGAVDDHYLRHEFSSIHHLYYKTSYRRKLSPWIVPSAGILFVLTAIQTFFTVYPYFHPRN